MTLKRMIGFCAIMVLGGCSLSRGASPPQQYVLGAQEAQAGVAERPGLAGVTIGIRRMDIAAYLVVPGILVRRGDREITSSGFHRWGEPIDAGIPRALAAYLRSGAPFGVVDIAPWPVRTGHDYLVKLNILHFEGRAPGDSTTTTGEVRVQANWEIVRGGDEAVLERGMTDFRQAGWTVGDYPDLVAMLDTGLQRVAADLMAALERASPVAR